MHKLHRSAVRLTHYKTSLLSCPYDISASAASVMQLRLKSNGYGYIDVQRKCCEKTFRKVALRSETTLNHFNICNSGKRGHIKKDALTD